MSGPVTLGYTSTCLLVVLDAVCKVTHLSELWLPVRFGAFISVATCDLEVAVETTNHK